MPRTRAKAEPASGAVTEASEEKVPDERHPTFHPSRDHSPFLSLSKAQNPHKRTGGRRGEGRRGGEPWKREEERGSEPRATDAGQGPSTGPAVPATTSWSHRQAPGPASVTQAEAGRLTGRYKDRPGWVEAGRACKAGDKEEMRPCTSDPTRSKALGRQTEGWMDGHRTDGP